MIYILEFINLLKRMDDESQLSWTFLILGWLLSAFALLIPVLSMQILHF